MTSAFASAISLSERTTCTRNSKCSFNYFSSFFQQRRPPPLRKHVSLPAPIPKTCQASAPLATSISYVVGQSTKPRILDALKESLSIAASNLAARGRTACLALLYVKSTSESHPADECKRVISVAKNSLAMYRVLSRDTKFFGCTTADYPGPENPSAVVALVSFPNDTHLRTFYIEPKAFNLDWTQQQWFDVIGTPSAQSSQQTIMLLYHPSFESVSDLLSSLDFAYPGVRKLGACAGHAHALDEVYLFNSQGAVKSGAIGLSFASPHVQIDVTVGQGSRGVGPLLEVLEVRNGNEITRVKEIGTPAESQGAPMMLMDMWAGTDAISQEDREYARKYLLMGIEVPKVVDLAVSSLSSMSEGGPKVVDAEEERKQPVEMVIRKVVGFDQGTRSLAVEGDVRLGSRVQFQIRDEEAARSELKTLLNRLTLEGSSRMIDGMSLMGAMIIVDSERGENLYGNIAADADRTMYCERFPVPTIMMTSEQQIGPLPAGGLLGTAGNSFLLSASVLYLSIYGRVAKASS